MTTLPTPYYDDGQVTIFHGDCNEILPQIEAGSIDLVFTSPPYNLGITSGGGFSKDAHDLRGGRKGSKWDAPALAFGYGMHDDAMPWPEYEEWQRSILRECWRCVPDSGAIYYQHKPRVQDKILRTPLEYNPDLPIRQIVIWERAGGINFSPSHYCPTHEWIVIFAKPDFALTSRGASGVGDVWRIPQEANNTHPAPFPLALPLRAISTTSAQIILDPFMGSGTTLRAAKDLGRRAIGIELEERYCEIAVKRLSQSVMQFDEPATRATEEVA